MSKFYVKALQHFYSNKVMHVPEQVYEVTETRKNDLLRQGLVIETQSAEAEKEPARKNTKAGSRKEPDIKD